MGRITDRPTVLVRSQYPPLERKRRLRADEVAAIQYIAQSGAVTPAQVYEQARQAGWSLVIFDRLHGDGLVKTAKPGKYQLSDFGTLALTIYTVWNRRTKETAA